jgi:HEPN domain-containing protein
MTLRLNPLSEVEYRAKLADRYLADAEGAFERGDLRGTVASSRLAAENAAKAVVAVYRVPSWSHDPSHELREVAAQMPASLKPLAEELASIAELLAPEHGRATYGEPARGLTPWELYTREDAEAALQRARRAVELAKTILKELRVAREERQTGRE